MDTVSGGKLLLRNNQPDGFDCPGCAWPDPPKHTSAFEFCENGAKAVSWEATKKRATPAVFAAHTVSELLRWPDRDIENLGPHHPPDGLLTPLRTPMSRSPGTRLSPRSRRG